MKIRKLMTLLLLFSISVTLGAKVFSIQNKNILYKLEAIPETHSLLTNAFENLSLIGKSEVVETTTYGVMTNFEVFEQEGQTDEDSESTDVEVLISKEEFSISKYFLCLEKVKDILFSSKVRKARGLEDIMADNFLDMKRGLNRGLCSMYLGKDFNIISDKETLKVLQVNQMLGAQKSELFNDLFIKSRNRNVSANKFIAMDLILNEMAYDALVNSRSIQGLQYYKDIIINSFESEANLFEKNLEEKFQKVSFDTTSVKEEIEAIE